jgi:hypothetical protein
VSVLPHRVVDGPSRSEAAEGTKRATTRDALQVPWRSRSLRYEPTGSREQGTRVGEHCTALFKHVFPSSTEAPRGLQRWTGAAAGLGPDLRTLTASALRLFTIEDAEGRLQFASGLVSVHHQCCAQGALKQRTVISSRERRTGRAMENFSRCGNREEWARL